MPVQPPAPAANPTRQAVAAQFLGRPTLRTVTAQMLGTHLVEKYPPPTFGWPYPVTAVAAPCCHCWTLRLTISPTAVSPI